MATGDKNYDHADYAVRREHHAGEAGGGATTEYCKFNHFQKMKLKAAHAVVTTAGTSTAHGFDVYSGTTSVGSITLGTAAADSTGSSATLNTSIASLAQISVKSLADATGKANIVYEFEVEPGALRTT